MKTYTSPKAEIKSFVSESVIAASGVNNTNPLLRVQSKAFSNSEANVSWRDIVK